MANQIETQQVDTNPSDEASVDSLPFIGQWNTLISTTNWDKGEIIVQWRDKLKNSGAPSASYSDEAWSQLVGGVTPQHVGRLRRTTERFGHVYKEYSSLFWSHFYAAIDWDDAEMWLEGAVQNTWSISKMRHQRWETLGKIPEDKPKNEDIVVSESNEETQSLALSEPVTDRERDYIEGPRHEGPDFGDEGEPSSERNPREIDDLDQNQESESKTVGPPIKPFEAFEDLPNDVADAAESFKLAIIRHRAANWEDISQNDMLGLLDALKQLTSVEN